MRTVCGLFDDPSAAARDLLTSVANVETVDVTPLAISVLQDPNFDLALQILEGGPHALKLAARVVRDSAEGHARERADSSRVDWKI